jgi:LacI family transcriptional regulator
MTVSLVLNNADSGRVSPETRERVLAAIRELGYRPPAARAAITDPAEKTLTVGVLTSLHTNIFAGGSYAGRVLDGIFKAPETRGINVLIFAATLFQDRDIHRGLRQYCDGSCDGLLIIAPRRDDPLLPALRQRGIPFVVIGSAEYALTGEPLFPSIDIDNQGTAAAAVDHLCALGHRRIAYLGGPEEFVFSVEERQLGYQEALRAHGVRPDPALERLGLHGDADAARAVDELLALPAERRPTALFCWNDETALAAVRRLRSRGVSVPGAMSVLGIDDVPPAAAGRPPLTTFRQPWAALGAAALAEVLARLGAEGASRRVERRLFPAEFIARATTGFVPASPPVTAG